MDTVNLLSIIIPVKNDYSVLLLLLDQLDKQTFKDFKIIIADNSENNMVRQICNERNILCVAGGLPAKARNNGAVHAESKYLLFLDSDMYIKEDFIEKALTALDSKNSDCISFGFKPQTSNAFLKALHLIAKYYFVCTTFIGFAHGIGGAILVKSKVHYDVGGFDETITVAEDENYFLRLSKKFNYRFVLAPFVELSVRRFLKYGILTLSLKYVSIEMYRIFRGEIKNNKISYFETHTILK